MEWDKAGLETGCWPSWSLGILPALRFLEQGPGRDGTFQLLVGEQSVNCYGVALPLPPGVHRALTLLLGSVWLNHPSGPPTLCVQEGPCLLVSGGKARLGACLRSPWRSWQMHKALRQSARNYLVPDHGLANSGFWPTLLGFPLAELGLPVLSHLA